MQLSVIIRNLFQRKLILTAALLLLGISAPCLGLQNADPQPLELGIIVTSTEAEAAGILQQLNAGWDFSVLAKEKSIDPTSSDGGYMGKFSPIQLRPELREAWLDTQQGNSAALFL